MSTSCDSQSRVEALNRKLAGRAMASLSMRSGCRLGSCCFFPLLLRENLPLVGGRLLLFGAGKLSVLRVGELTAAAAATTAAESEGRPKKLGLPVSTIVGSSPLAVEVLLRVVLPPLLPLPLWLLCASGTRAGWASVVRLGEDVLFVSMFTDPLPKEKFRLMSILLDVWSPEKLSRSSLRREEVASRGVLYTPLVLTLLLLLPRDRSE